MTKDSGTADSDCLTVEKLLEAKKFFDTLKPIIVEFRVKNILHFEHCLLKQFGLSTFNYGVSRSHGIVNNPLAIRVIEDEKIPEHVVRAIDSDGKINQEIRYYEPAK